MAFAGAAGRFVEGSNAAVTSLLDSSVTGPLLARFVARITYTGRRSGRTFTLPIWYHRDGDTVNIRVAMAAKKTWWRNFLDDGGPMTIRLAGTDRAAHAVARRDARGRVVVTATLAGRDASGGI
jgi:hypothetical protein